MGAVEIKFTDSSERFLRRLDNAEQIVKKYAFDVEGNARAEIMSGPKSGRMYGKHRASAAGESPATDTGKLVNSIQSKKESRFVWIVGVGAKSAKPLELGTRRMGARPFLLPALKKVEKAFTRAIEGIFRD